MQGMLDNTGLHGQIFDQGNRGRQGPVLCCTIRYAESMVEKV